MISIDLMRVRLAHWREKIIMALVWKLPRGIVAWCVIRAAAYATSGKWSKDAPDDLSPLDILKRWSDDNPEGLSADEIAQDKARAMQRLIENVEIMVIVWVGVLLFGLLLWRVGILK